MDSGTELPAIAFFDLETTDPRGHREVRIVEFGAVVLCARTLEKIDSYHTLVRPSDHFLQSFSDRDNDITRNALRSAPSFRDIAHRVFDLLHGRTWAGHNILKFDCRLIMDAFEDIGWEPPTPSGTIDTLQLLRPKFGRRAGDMRMATLARYFGLGEQTHRSLDDVEMNIKIFKKCATILLMESSSGYTGFLEPKEVSEDAIHARVSGRNYEIMHGDEKLQLYCAELRVRFGISQRYANRDGQPRLNFVVDVSAILCGVFDSCEEVASRSFIESRSKSKWWPLVKRDYDFPTVRLAIVTEPYSDKVSTEIYEKHSCYGHIERVGTHRSDADELLDKLLTPGTLIDACLSLDPYDYGQNAGVRLTLKKLIIYSD
ncbi:protein NEN1-like [Malania oleifera]|uniref:protein NEN1-like n=1 Tax=Malania oleifera TaxID=397392 RepID=UPI0025AE7704|nr:protein NEN1-like [Malania oleifera]